jgi:hypothetical protein
MKRSAIALSASVLALAFHAAPAAAQTGDPGQQIGDSIGAAQVGTVQADVPVRVLSDGDNAEPAGVTATPQDSGDSTAAGQVGSADVNAPVRVLSDGENAAGGGGSSPAPTQDATDSTGAAQAGPVDVDAPVRVLSDGDNAGDGGDSAAPGGTEQTADGSTGGAQIEPADVSAPIRVLSDGDDGTTATTADTSPNGDTPAGGDGTTGDTVPAIGGGDPADDTAPAVDQLPALDPVAEAEPGNGDGGTLPDGGELLPIAAGDVAGDTASELPLTGLAVASLVLTGMALIAGGGGALHCMPSRH